MQKKKTVISLILVSSLAILVLGAYWLVTTNGPNPGNGNGDKEYMIENAFPNLSFNQPVGLKDSEDGSGNFFVIELDGRVWRIGNESTTSTKELFLDISVNITGTGEGGLLGFAFHPDFHVNGLFYVSYTLKPSGNTRISQFSMNETNPDNVNMSSEKIILDVVQPFSNHNGGDITFGPDEFLYISLGDGGGSGDPYGNGQNRSTLLGTILRIDVDSGSPYAIPVTNPFHGNTDGYMEEIFAFGFRNPWRMSFDAITGILWVGDVGQASWEEINVVENGKNYGWNTMEGMHLYAGGIPNVTPVVPPVFEYANAGGNIAVTGGYVYRGNTFPGLNGSYIFGDFGSGKIWAIDYHPSNGTVSNHRLLVDTNLQVPSFAVDGNDEIYICGFDGNIYRIIENATSS